MKDTLCSLLAKLINSVEVNDRKKYISIKEKVTKIAEELFPKHRLETEEEKLIDTIINYLTYVSIFPDKREELLKEVKINFKILKEKRREE